MSFVPESLQRIFLASIISSLPVTVYAQQFTLTPQPDATKPVIEPVPQWGKRLVESINQVWTEGNQARRNQKLSELVEATPGQLAYLTRVFQQNDSTKTGQAIFTLKEYFSVIRRVQWQPSDVAQMQRIVASWSVVVPQLVKNISLPEMSAYQRRILEQALVDLAHITRDPQLGTPLAKQIWQKETPVLTGLLKHPKTSVKLTVLGVLEAIGQDAQPAGEAVVQCLKDADRFVRMSSVRTLQAMGPDSRSLDVIARLKNDEDSQVRETVMLALQSTSPATIQVKTETKAQPGSPVVAQNQSVEAAPTDRPKPILPKLTEAKAMPASKPIESPAMVGKRDNSTTKTAVAQPAVLPNSIPAIPVEGSPVSLPVLPAQPAAGEAPASQALPLFGPPVSSTPAPVVKPKMPATIQPVAAASTVPQRVEAKTKPVSLWLPRLHQGTVEQQVQAVREIGKLGTQAADAVPKLAEVLTKGDIAVRREVPDALVKIGSPAKMATAVLERCLLDPDTDLKVNAARALLELADK